ncbi:squamosa promoter-binding-like protein 4 [Oryza brachyantha]|uniref:SBP-type domain-containing protein n=1 Tax=Oryza brachyantha TaxID=4533 RepID=J3LA17_ORYBR|nr:squamosa promoter-binding-like protein 4 [Oryza brachyantha]
MDWMAPPKPTSPPLLWDWADAAVPGSSGEAAAAAAAPGRRRKEKRARAEEVGGGGGGGGGGEKVRCQVEGCGLELVGVKDYHRKHRVCVAHSKFPRVIVAGQERRFCQQCSRFHALSEFDQKKRSCRRRLYDHNARRRKPQTDAFSFAAARVPLSLLFDDSREISFVWNKDLLSQVKPFAVSPWESSSEVGTTDGHIYLDKSHLSKSLPTFNTNIYELLRMKGPDASITASKFDGAPDLQHALSLLSASSSGLPDPVQQASRLIQFTGGSQNSRGLPPLHGGNSGSASCADVQPTAQPAHLVRFTMGASSNACESNFFSLNQIN